MKTILLDNKKEITLEPNQDTRYVLVPENETSVEIKMTSGGISTELVIVYLLDGKNVVNLKTSSSHLVPNTSCNVEIKAGLKGSSVSSYEGRIIIPKGSQGTSSFLKEDVLLFGDNIKNESKPILEIEANDVKASHGATSGRISEDQVYYLMSRGLDRRDAEEMILEGFFDSLLNKISDEKIKEEVRSKLFGDKNVN